MNYSSMLPFAALLAFIIVGVLLVRATLRYFILYNRKKHPRYPIVPQDVATPFSKDPLCLLRVYPLTPFFMWKIVFERHEEKELDDAAKRVRYLLVLSIGTLLLQFLFPLPI